MLNSPTQKLMNILVFIAAMMLLSGCSSDTDDNLAAANVRGVSAFEGSSLDLEVNNKESELTWHQTQGPIVTVEYMGDNQYTLTAPWLLSESEIAEFEVIDGDEVIERIRLTIKNRHFLIFRVENTDNDKESLFLKYVSAIGEQDVPTLETVFLSNTPVGQDICAFVTSPSGQYVAYTIAVQVDLLGAGCRGLYIVDIASQTSWRVSPLDADNNDIKTTVPKWSPDGTKIAYKGTYGEGTISQHYVYDLNNNTTSYINYGNNDLASELWPDEDLYPVADGGNPYGLGLIEDPLTSGLTWLDNNNGVGFLVSNQDSFDYHPYLASIQGDARLLKRGVTIADYLLTLDADAHAEHVEDILSCPVDSTCTILLPILPQYELIRPRFYNPEQLGSSVEGHFSFIANIRLNSDSVTRVLAVNPPVIDAQPASNVFTRIAAEHVFNAAWSPKAMQLAFSGESMERFRYDKAFELLEDTFPQIYGTEIPGQLYIYNNYTIDPEESQERLAYPRPEIDDNYVRKLSWSNSGDYIAYVRGEENFEGTYYTSLWVTFVDDLRDESQGTIDANTTLLENLRTSDGFSDYMTDFRWLPNNAGILTVVQNINELNGSLDSTTLRYFPKDGTQTVEFSNLVSKIHTKFYSLSLSFSPDGRYFAYKDLESTEATAKTAIFIQSVAGGNRVKVNTPPGATISSTTPFWSPSGDQLIFSVQLEAGEFAEFYLVNVDGESQPLQNFFQSGQKIRRVSNEINSHINLNFPGLL